MKAPSSAWLALGIFYEAWPHLWYPQVIPKLGKGMLLLLGAALVNLVLGVALITVGKRHRSLVLIADGKHVLTDVYTSGGVLLGLVGVMFTGRLWLDGAVAYLMAFNILFTGARLVHQAAAGLMDTSDPELLEEICRVIAQPPRPLDRYSSIAGPPGGDPRLYGFSPHPAPGPEPGREP